MTASVILDSVNPAVTLCPHFCAHAAPCQTLKLVCSKIHCFVLKALFGVFLSPEHLVVAVPVAVLSAIGGFLVSQYLNRRCCKKGMVNTCISKDSPKVVHSFDMEDIGSKAVYCRCWKSKKVRPPSLSFFRVCGQLEHLYWEIKISFITRHTH